MKIPNIFTENFLFTLFLSVFYFSVDRELFCSLRSPVYSSILPGIRCGPDPTEQPKSMPANDTHPLYSSAPSYVADRNFDEPHCAGPEVPDWPLSLQESSYRDAHEHKNRRQDICYRRRASRSYHYCGKYRRHFSKLNGCYSTGTGALSFEIVSFSYLVPPKQKSRKAAQLQPAKGTSSPCRHCSRATFRHLSKQTHDILDRSSLTSALISAHLRGDV